MRYRLLGPTTAEDQGHDITPGSPQDRVILTLLLLHRTTTLSVDQIIDGVWGDDPPRTAAHAVHAAISRLRKVLGAEEIQSIGPGYAMPDPIVDIDEVTALIAEGRDRLTQDPDIAEQLLLQALSMWRGEALLDVAYHEWAQPEIRRLDELHTSAVVDRLAALLALGRDGEAVPDLEALVERHPHRERAWGLLLIALCRQGRPADALMAYRRAATALGTELGVTPSSELRDLESRVLTEDPTLSDGWLWRFVMGTSTLAGRAVNE